MLLYYNGRGGEEERHVHDAAFGKLQELLFHNGIGRLHLPIFANRASILIECLIHLKFVTQNQLTNNKSSYLFRGVFNYLHS